VIRDGWNGLHRSLPTVVADESASDHIEFDCPTADGDGHGLPDPGAVPAHSPQLVSY